MTHRLARAREKLACPGCRGPLADAHAALRCERCETDYRVTRGVPCFRGSGDEPAEQAYLGGLRGGLRRRPVLYRWVFRLFAPVLVTGPDVAARVAPRLENDGVVLDLGAGNDRRHPDFLNIDILPYPEVDVIADGERLPFGAGAVNGVVSIAVLEHVPRPDLMIEEVHRVLAPGGRFFLVVPFLQPFHAAPHDYRRWTLVGLRAELEREARFRVLGSGVYCGPASALSWVLADWSALLLSLGVRSAQRVLSPLLQALFSPIKWLDLVLARLPGAADVSSVVWVEGERT